MKKTILPIGDTHREPGQPDTLTHILGKFITEKKPDIIIHMGDIGSFNSLSPHELGTVHNEGQRYKKDIQSVNRFIQLLDTYISKLKYNPELYFIEGNHEQWIERAVIKQPSLYDSISLSDIKFWEYGWKVIPFLQPLKVQGITFQHYFTSGVMGRPIGGDNQCSTIIKKIQWVDTPTHLTIQKQSMEVGRS